MAHFFLGWGKGRALNGRAEKVHICGRVCPFPFFPPPPLKKRHSPPQQQQKGKPFSSPFLPPPISKSITSLWRNFELGRPFSPILPKKMGAPFLRGFMGKKERRKASFLFLFPFIPDQQQQKKSNGSTTRKKGNCSQIHNFCNIIWFFFNYWRRLTDEIIASCLVWKREGLFLQITPLLPSIWRT